MKSQILPSLLAADMGRLADEAKRAEDAGADAIHLDIMDGHFVPNISMGPAIVEMVRKHVDMPLNVHLMLLRPDLYLKTFIEAGADTVQIHVEAECNIEESLERIRELGARCGIVINPGTVPEMVFPALGKVDEVLCMTVRPGYGGQAFMPEVLPSIKSVWEEAQRIGKSDLTIMVDGGINRQTGIQCAELGANAFVAGTFLFRAADMATEITMLRDATTRALPKP
jgi:ribulose-phosphate 3-epimerase